MSMTCENVCKRCNKELVKELSIPALGTKDLEFPTQYCRTLWGQFTYLLWKQNLTYWRSPGYNLVRLSFTLISALMFGTIFWQRGSNMWVVLLTIICFHHFHVDYLLPILVLLMFVNVVTPEAHNKTCSQLWEPCMEQHYCWVSIIALQFSPLSRLNALYSTESVEQGCIQPCPMPLLRSDHLYLLKELQKYFIDFVCSWTSFVCIQFQVVIEFPYIFFQTIMYGLLVYSLIGFQWVVSKFLWFIFTMFCTFLTFTYYGMMAVSITPNIEVAAIVASTFYSLFNLFSGFYIPKPVSESIHYSLFKCYVS